MDLNPLWITMYGSIITWSDETYSRDQEGLTTVCTNKGLQHRKFCVNNLSAR